MLTTLQQAKLKELDIQIGESSTADFEENTWTFEMPEDYHVQAGKFAIVPIEVLTNKLLK